MKKWMCLAVVAFALSTVSAEFTQPSRADSTNLVVGTGNKMQATLMTPDGPGPYPGILLLHTSGGLEQADFAFAQRLVDEHYVVLVPAFLAAYGITARTRRATFTTDADPIYADFVEALDTLRHNPKVANSKLGAIGFSNGGYFATWLAATGKVNAAVAYYGALSGAGSDIPLQRFSGAFTKSSAPMLILHGMADETVPVGAAHHLASIIAAAGSPYEIHLYGGAGHRFDRTPSPQNNAAAADAWPRTVAFFAKYLKRQ